MPKKTTKKTTKKKAARKKTAKRKAVAVVPDPVVEPEPAAPELSPREQKIAAKAARREEERLRLEAQAKAQRDREQRRKEKAAAVATCDDDASNVVPMPSGDKSQLTVDMDDVSHWKIRALKQELRVAQQPLGDEIRRQMATEYHARLQAAVSADPEAARAQREYVDAVNAYSDHVEAKHPGFAIIEISETQGTALLEHDPAKVGQNRLTIQAGEKG